jgi:CheY-like chemotaxis protein
VQNILLIDDDLDYRETIGAWLSDAGYEVQIAESTDEAFQALLKDPFDLIICDLHLPFALDKRVFQYAYSYTVGVRTIQELKLALPETPILAISATMPWDMPKVLKEIPSVPWLSKPFSHAELLATVRRLLNAEARLPFVSQ